MRLFLTLALCLGTLCAAAQSGGLTAQDVEQLRQGEQQHAQSDRTLRGALFATSINLLATNPLRAAEPEGVYFSHRVPSRGVTDQKQSGRCWLFTGLNVLRAQMMRRSEVERRVEFSQSYCFFYDQLEKANLFLQATIDHAREPMESQTVQWLFKNPLSDGGTFCGVQDVVMKYGLVPAEVMPEGAQASSTSKMSQLISLKLREYGLKLREAVARGEKAGRLGERKLEMLRTVYHMLCLCLGEPPTEFSWALRDAEGRTLSEKQYTPQSFYREFLGQDLRQDYVLLMNDPTRPYHKTYTIDLDRHSYDGLQWTYLNLPMDELRQMAIASIRDSVMMYFSCDVGQCYNSKTGLLSLDNYNYADLLGTTFPMNKAERIASGASASSHAMTLCAVDLDEQGRPQKWLVENSWGPTAGYQGHLIMTDEWLGEYMFRLVVERRFVPEATLRLLQQKPTVLPAWDPLFSAEE